MLLIGYINKMNMMFENKNNSYAAVKLSLLYSASYRSEPSSEVKA